jgi:hypothetical protein
VSGIAAAGAGLNLAAKGKGASQSFAQEKNCVCYQKWGDFNAIKAL